MQPFTTVIGGPAAFSHMGTSPPTQLDLEGKNWIGLLMEYRQAHPNLAGPDYRESSPAFNLFACSVTIAESPEPLGNPNVIFSRKKYAKQYAAKLAIEWLILNKHMPADGGVTFPKPHLQPVVNVPVNDSKGISTGQQVAQLAINLGLSQPTYVIVPHDGLYAMYHGYAHFNDDPRVEGKIGEFSGVHGKKVAKEKCAREVLTVLEGIAAFRAKLVEDATRERSGTLEGEESLQNVEGEESRQNVEGEQSRQSVEEIEMDVKNIIHDLTTK